MIKNYLKFLKSENFNQDREQINQENKIGLELIIVATALFLLINVALRFIAGRELLHPITMNLEAVYFAFVLLFYFLCLKKKKANFTLSLYLFEIPVLLIAMFDAVHYEPYNTTFLFMIFLMVFPVFILDKPWRIALFIDAMAVMYAIAAYRVEPANVYTMDMIHLVSVVLLAVGSSLFFVIVRLRVIRYADHIATLAETDPLTGLFNRSGAANHVHPELPGIFVYLDLDKFKGVNDQFGHAQGDQVLVETANALRSNFRRNDIIIRLGGDEFAVFSPGHWELPQVEAKLSALLQSIQSMAMADESDTMTASIGCAFAPEGCESLDELTKIADQAMYEAKKDGKNGFRIVTVKL